MNEYEGKRREQRVTLFSVIESKEFLVSFLVLAVISIYCVLSFAQVVQALSDYDDLSKRLEKRAVAFGESIAYGDTEGSLESVDKIKGDIKEAKLLAQSLGQEVKFFQYSGWQSKLIEKEVLLNTAYDIINFSNGLERQIFSLPSNGIFGDDYILDLTVLRSEIRSVLKGLNKSLSKTERALTNTSLVEESFVFTTLDKSKEQLSLVQGLAETDLNWLASGNKRILIIFQNNSELRGGSGGSLGSFGVMNIENGKLTKIDFGKNIYKLDKDFMEREQIPVPLELEALNNGLWTMKHAGFAVDGKEALSKIEWFYNKETGESVDGTITIDTTAFGKILSLIGNIEMPEYDLVLTPDNFKSEIEREVQVKYFEREGGKEENEPKKILGEVMPVFLDRLIEKTKDKEGAVKLAITMAECLEGKSILFHMAEPEFQKRLDQLDFTGRVKPSEGDYLYVNNSNLGGGKTNQLVKESIKLNIEIDDYGRIKNRLDLTRFHSGDGKFPDGRDQNFIRTLIPSDSTISAFSPLAGNFQVWHDRGYRNVTPWYSSKEADKTAINFWMSTEPGATSLATIDYFPNYTVSTRDDFVYKLLIQKQPGAPSSQVEIELKYPKGFEPKNVRNFDPEKRLIKLKLELEKDEEVEVLFEQTS